MNNSWANVDTLFWLTQAAMLAIAWLVIRALNRPVPRAAVRRVSGVPRVQQDIRRPETSGFTPGRLTNGPPVRPALRPGDRPDRS